MTFRLPLNITSHFTMKYPFTKTRFRIKFHGLAGKMCIANFQQNNDACFFATKSRNKKHFIIE